MSQGGFFRLGELFRVLLTGRDDHRLLELVLFRVRRLLVGEPQLMVTYRDDVAVLQRVFLDQLAVDVRAVGAVEVLEE